MCLLGESNFKGWKSTMATADCGTHQRLSYCTQVYKLHISSWLAWDKIYQMSFWLLYHRLVPLTPVQLEDGLSWPKHHGGEKTTCNFPEPRSANSSKASRSADRVILAHNDGRHYERTELCLHFHIHFHGTEFRHTAIFTCCWRAWSSLNTDTKLSHLLPGFHFNTED